MYPLHQHGQNVSIVLADESLRAKLLKVTLGGDVKRIIKFPLRRRKLQVLNNDLNNDENYPEPIKSPYLPLLPVDRQSFFRQRHACSFLGAEGSTQE